MTNPDDRREQALAELEAEHPGCGPAVRAWLAHEDAADHQRRGTWTLAQVVDGTLSADTLIEPITALMRGVADDIVWLLSDEPIAWRQVMTDCLRERFALFLELVEPAQKGAP